MSGAKRDAVQRNQPSFDVCQNYLGSQWLHGSSNGFHGPKTRPAITISRETAAGAVSIAKMLVEELNRRNGTGPWAAFDSNLVEKVLEDYDLPARIKRFMPEAATSGLENVVEELFGLHPPASTLAEHTNETMRRLARMGNVVLVGRGAHFVTADMPNVLHVRIIGPRDKRVKHAEEFYHLAPDEAAKFVEKTDRAREQYVRAHFHTTSNDPLPYDLTINTGRLSFETAVHLILEAVASKQVNGPISALTQLV